MKGISMRIALYGALVLLVPFTASAADKNKNFGLSSVNQPVVTAAGASVPSCPNWESAGRDSAALTDSNYGCATNSNLAAMIAEPADLLHGRTDGTAGTDANIAVKAIKAYREAATTGKDGVAKVSSKGAGGGQ